VRAFQRAHHPLPENGDPGDAATQAEIDRTVRDFVDGGEYYRGFGPAIAAPRFATAVAELARAYCELEIEPDASGGGAATEIGPEQHRAALRWAIAEVQSQPWFVFGKGLPRDVAAMFSDEYETPFLFDIRHPEHYNRLRRPGFAVASPAHGYAKYWEDAASVLADDYRGLMLLYLRYLAGRASPERPPAPALAGYATPGLTVATALGASRLTPRTVEHGQLVIPNVKAGRNSGFTYWDRASLVFGGQKLHARGYYLDDCFTKSIVHEMGHILLLRHQFYGPRAPHHADGSCPEDHDSHGVEAPALVPDPVPYDRCLMGYAPCEGELCGKCQLKLRGWNISRMPT